MACIAAGTLGMVLRALWNDRWRSLRRNEVTFRVVENFEGDGEYGVGPRMLTPRLTLTSHLFSSIARLLFVYGFHKRRYARRCYYGLYRRESRLRRRRRWLDPETISEPRSGHRQPRALAPASDHDEEIRGGRVGCYRHIRSQKGPKRCRGHREEETKGIGSRGKGSR